MSVRCQTSNGTKKGGGGGGGGGGLNANIS